ncbi:hypothetical protein [Acrocarpospora macrocephala]|uniref:hypothetical protein n=1 Tax=Acrocarpospora macrocephala TaxID=150177 RepID=UPI0012D2DC30|nr:hypothetical protein [Acrocarpospora macrocephala]
MISPLVLVPWPLVAAAVLIGVSRTRPRWFPASTTRDLLVLIVAVGILCGLVVWLFAP